MSGPEEKHGNLEVVQSLEANEDETCQTFVLKNEDHTLGNALRYMLMKNRDVEFCGYSVPHPSENKINLRIQTKGPPATEVLRAGLTDLSRLCEHVLTTFDSQVELFKQNSDVNMDTD